MTKASKFHETPVLHTPNQGSRTRLGNYHVILYHVYFGVQRPMISMLFIPLRISEYPLS